MASTYDIFNASMYTVNTGDGMEVYISGALSGDTVISEGDYVRFHFPRTYAVPGGHDAYIFYTEITVEANDESVTSDVMPVEGTYGSDAASGGMAYEENHIYKFRRTSTGYTFSTDRRRLDVENVNAGAGYGTSLGGAKYIALTTSDQEFIHPDMGDFVYFHVVNDYALPDGYTKFAYTFSQSLSVIDPDTGTGSTTSTGDIALQMFAIGAASGDTVFRAGYTYGFIYDINGLDFFSEEAPPVPDEYYCIDFDVDITPQVSGSGGQVLITVNLKSGETFEIEDGNLLYLTPKQNYLFTGGYSSYSGLIRFAWTTYNPITGRSTTTTTNTVSIDGYFGSGTVAGDPMFLNGYTYTFEVASDSMGNSFKYNGAESPGGGEEEEDKSGDRELDFTFGQRVIHLDYTMRNLSVVKRINFRAGQRVLHIPLTFDAAKGSKILKFTAGQRVVYLSLSARLPVNTDVVSLRIGDLDPRTIGSLDPFEIPDMG